METKVEHGGSQLQIQEEQQQPLLENGPTLPTKPQKTPAQKAVRKTFKGSTNLAKLLPTGSVLAFQMLSPILSHEGQCRTILSRSLTIGLVTLCGLSCFILCFTDSFRDSRGKVRHGLATFRGLWIIDGSVKLSEEEAKRYRLSFLDFCHAFMSMVVFAAVALFDKNVVKCLWPAPSEEVKEILVAFPVGVGMVCSVLFLAFPTKRHGIGSPLSKN